MGRQNLKGAKKIIQDLCLERKIRASLDAEAQHPEIFSLIKNKDCITTPHPGEFKRMFGIEPGNTLGEKIGAAKRKASEYGITILLKSAKSVITDGSTVYVNSSGSPGMTCGGIGDTISGVVGALLAQTTGTDVKAIEVAASASYIVGLAGRRAVESKGFHIVATDIINEIPEVLKTFDRIV